MADFIDLENWNGDWIIDISNTNNHAGIERREASEKAEAILKIINEYRVYAHRFESLPTWDVLEFLAKLEKELFERYGRDVNNGELDRARNDYFLLTHKKPFMAWGIEEIRRRMDEYSRGEAKEIDNKDTLRSKKSQWKKAMKK